jgi:hypothetical protein
MKITTLSLRKVSLLVLVLVTTFFCLLINTVKSECNIKFGCLARQKFMSYVTVQGKDGQALPLRTILNYKVIYIFTDRIVFYTSTDASSPSLEPEDSTDQISKIEAKVERVINYGEIILDCGGFNNKLCHAQEYPGIDKVESFKIIQKGIPNNADVYCIVIPFFENGYKKFHEKMAYVCATASKDLYNVITFKNYLSRKIESYQLKMSNDRYNGFNGLLKRKGKFLITNDNKMQNVVAKIYNRGMSLTANDATRKFIKDYSFYQQREHNNIATIVSSGLAKNKVPPNWASGFSSAPLPECCIFFKGESQDLTLCLASNDGESLETASDICKVKMKSYFTDIWNSLRGIKFAEAYHELKHNQNKISNCKSDEYKYMKWRADKIMDYAINVDCGFVVNYVNGDDYSQKLNFCHKNYGDELKLELKLMSLDNEEIYDGINNCVYKDTQFSKVFGEKHFIQLMQKAKLYKVSSFLGLNESDDIDDDDGDANEIKHEIKHEVKNNNMKSENSLEDKITKNDENINFTELESLSERKGKKKKKTIKDYVYSQPKDTYEATDVNRMKIFRNTQMNEIQKSHTWTTAPSETVTEQFNRNAAAYGKPNTDEFVTFLGFLRDASYRASKVIAKNDEKKLLENMSK